MTKDDRLYGRFTLDFPDSPKIAPLSDLAFRTLVEMTLHSRRMLDDGFVDARIAARKWKSRAIEELCTNDTVNPSLIRVDGGFQIHDFAQHQQTRADIEKKRSAGSKGGRASAQARAQAGASADGEASSKLLTETESETDKDVADARPDVSRICDLLAARIEANGSKRPPIGKGWLDAGRKLIDLDKRPLAEIVSLIEWSQSDPFWRANVLSMPKLREKYDTLRLQRDAKVSRPNTDWALRA